MPTNVFYLLAASQYFGVIHIWIFVVSYNWLLLSYFSFRPMIKMFECGPPGVVCHLSIHHLRPSYQIYVYDFIGVLVS